MQGHHCVSYCGIRLEIILATSNQRAQKCIVPFYFRFESDLNIDFVRIMSSWPCFRKLNTINTVVIGVSRDKDAEMET